jgi:hypothetical protein
LEKALTTNLNNMNMHQDPYMNFADMGPEEMGFLQQATAKELNEDQKRYFYTVYSSKRKNSQEILDTLLLLGFIVVAGITAVCFGSDWYGYNLFFTGRILFYRNYC